MRPIDGLDLLLSKLDKFFGFLNLREMFGTGLDTDGNLVGIHVLMHAVPIIVFVARITF